MKREIKFRAWDKDRKQMFNVTTIFGISEDKAQPWVVDNGMYRPKNFVLEQFTGLTDVNGKDVYEGDIIEFFGANKKIKTKKEFGIIVYKADRYGAGFNSIIQNKEHGYGGINIVQDIVIGNVHTNPELLEVDE